MKIADLQSGGRIPTLYSLREAGLEFLIDSPEACPNEVRQKLHNAITTPGLGAWDELIEITYAKMDDCGPIIKIIAAGAATAFEEGQFMAKPEASALKSQIFKREAGISPPTGEDWPAKENDPEPESLLVDQPEPDSGFVEEPEPPLDPDPE